eukprot:14071-Heterococcus_DN1.PRE.1
MGTEVHCTPSNYAVLITTASMSAASSNKRSMLVQHYSTPHAGSAYHYRHIGKNAATKLEYV